MVALPKQLTEISICPTKLEMDFDYIFRFGSNYVGNFPMIKEANSTLAIHTKMVHTYWKICNL